MAMTPVGNGGVFTDGNGGYFDAQGRPISQADPGRFSNGAGQFWDAQGNAIQLTQQRTDDNGPSSTIDSWTPVNPSTTGPVDPGVTPRSYDPTTPTPTPTTTATTGTTPAAPTAPTVPTAPAFQGPPAFSFREFNAPSAADVQNDPGYQFQLQQGLSALGANRAAAGTLNTGGTLKDYVGFASNLASTKYNDLFNRSVQTYGLDRGNAIDNYNTNYGTQYKDPYQINYQTQYADPFQMGLQASGQQIQQGQFGATLAQQDRIAQQQFGLSYAQLNAQQKAQADQLAQNQSQFTATQKQNQSQYTSTLNQNQGQFQSNLDFNKWLQQYNMTRNDRNDAFDQQYKILGLT